MKYVNRVTLRGCITKDAQMKTTANGSKVVLFRMLTCENRRGANGVFVEQKEWHNIVIWNKLAERYFDFIKRGKEVFLAGKIQTRCFEKDGVKRYYTEIVGVYIRFFDNRHNYNKSATQIQHPNDAEFDSTTNPDFEYIEDIDLDLNLDDTYDEISEFENSDME